MRSSIRFGLVAVGTLALLTIGFVTFRARLEPTAQAQRTTQVAGCDGTIAPSRTNPCLVISSFRQNGPAGTQDEFVEIFNASTLPVTVSALSDDPAGSVHGIGVFVSAGNGRHPTFGQVANVASLACQIPGPTVINGRRWYLCGGVTYSLSALGTNSGATHSVPDQTIGAGNASIGTLDIPDDAGMALLNLGSNVVFQCVIGAAGCPSGFAYSDPNQNLGLGAAVVLDKVGFNPYGPNSPMNVGPQGYPGNLYPSLAAQYCEGTLVPALVPGGLAKNLGCLQPVGDASVITLGANAPCPGAGINGPGTFGVTAANPLYTTGGPVGQYDTIFPVVDSGFITRADGLPSATRKCYGESGQYKIERRRSAQTFATASGEIHKDSYNSVAVVVSPPQDTRGACAHLGAQCGNNDDFILDAPNPAAFNVGATETGVLLVTSVLGNAWPHACDGPAPGQDCTTPNPAGAPKIHGQTQFTQDMFDTCAAAVIPCTVNQLGPRNAERRYAQDPNISGTNNDPFGTFILRLRYTNNLGVATTGQRWRIDDISTLCGGQTGTTTVILTSPNIPPPPNPGTAGTQTSGGVATQEARNLRGPDNSTIPAQTPLPSCQGEGSDAGGGAFTSILKGVNHYGEIVVDSTGTARVVWGTVLEDVFTSPAARPVTGALAPFGGGSNASFVANTTTVGGLELNIAPLGPAAIPFLGDGVSGGTGTYAFPIASGGTVRIAFKFGVVRSGRFKVLLGREVGTGAIPAGPTVAPLN